MKPNITYIGSRPIAINCKQKHRLTLESAVGACVHMKEIKVG